MPRSRQTVLVTGGAGYIGSLLVPLLLRHGFKVRVLDNLSFGGESLLGFLHHSDFDFCRGDIREGNTLKRALAGVDAVVHLAAIVGDPACRQQPDLARAVNGDASLALADEARTAGVKRFLFASTCSNYGKMDSDLGVCDESSPLKPVSLYAELKVAFERHLLALDPGDMAAVCLRFATAYGLSPRPRFDLTVNEFTRDLYLRKNLDIYGEQFWRPYCHTSDIAAACHLALIAPTEAVAGQAFNVGNTDENYRKKQLVDLILNELPDRAELVSYVRRDEDPRDYRVNCHKIRDSLGFLTKWSVPDGVSEIIRALREQVIKEPEHERYRNL